MTDAPDPAAPDADLPAAARAQPAPLLSKRSVRGPLLVVGLGLLLAGLLLAAGRVLPTSVPFALRLRALGAEATRSGVAGAMAGGLGLALTGLLACAAMRMAQRRAAAPPPLSRAPRRGAWRWRPLPPGRMARTGQGTLVPVLAALAAAAALWLRPGPTWIGLPLAADAYLLAGFLFVLAFPLLVAERTVAAWPPAVLPEAAALRCLLLLPVLAAAGGGLVEVGRGLGRASPAWLAGGFDVLLAAIGAELAVRAAVRWFLPPPPDAAARAAVASLLAMLLAGAAGPRGEAGAVTPLRAHFGLDFSRSWALAYLRRAAVPAVALTLLFCWALSGVALIPLDRRGVYEAFGAPVAVFGPGLHVGLPWPFGRVRAVELGIVHAVALGDPSLAPALPDVAPTAAEAPPGPLDDRLWTGTHPAEADYLIASPVAGAGAGAGAAPQDGADAGAGDGPQGRTGAGFQIISADLRVLWRVGLADADARQAAYAAADPDALVRVEASRLVARFFAGRTLDDLLAERRETMAEDLRAALARQVAAAAAGIEVLAVVVEAVHPPSGAAAAYHAVQAAEIESRTSVATERGRAHGTASLARQEARTLADNAGGAAAEVTRGAEAEAIRFAADARAYAAAGRAFLVERYDADLSAALARAPLTILDNRLGPADAPVIDLRPPASLALPPAGPGDPD